MNLTLNAQKNEMSVPEGFASNQPMTHQKYLDELSRIVLTGFKENQSHDFIAEELTRLANLDPNTSAELGLHEDPQSIRNQIIEPAWKHLKGLVKDSDFKPGKLADCLLDKGIPIMKAGVDCGKAVAGGIKNIPNITGECAPVLIHIAQCALDAIEQKR